MIVDTHTHVLGADEQRYPRQLSAKSQWTDWVRDMPVSAERLQDDMDGAEVDKALLVQAMGVYRFDNSYVADSAAKHGRRLGFVCIVDPEEAEAAERLAYWVKERGAVGLRLFNSTEPEGEWLDDPATFPVWERAEELGIPVCVQMRFHQVPKLRNMLERFAHVPVILDHMAGPPSADPPPYEGAKPLFELAGFSNLALKFSTPSLYAFDEDRSRVESFLGMLVERFGAERLMWGTNYPNTYDRSYREMVELSHRALSFLPTHEKQLIMGDNAVRVWSL